MWCSSLTDSSSRGKPDNMSLDLTTRTSWLSEMFEVTSKPVVYDADNGGNIEHLKFVTRRLEKLGVSAIVIEDKIGIKKNSLFKDQSKTKLDSVAGFSKKIKVIRQNRISDDFFIIARLESLIVKKGINDALKRAEEYSKAGADLILIHSKKKKTTEVFKFAKLFRKSKFYKPLVAVPSTYSTVKEKDLIKHGFKLVIYANHMLRSSYLSMQLTAQKILKNQRSKETEKNMISINEIIELIE